MLHCYIPSTNLVLPDICPSLIGQLIRSRHKKKAIESQDPLQPLNQVLIPRILLCYLYFQVQTYTSN